MKARSNQGAVGWLALVLAALWSGMAGAQQLPPPTFIPGDGTLVPTNVTIASVVQEAKVYYTTDGSFPTTNATLYSTPLTLTNTTTLWAKIVKAGWMDSDAVMATFYYRPELVTVQKLVVNDDSLRPSVNIAVSPASIVRSYAIEESVPLPLLVTNINLGGVWDATNRIIRWGPYVDNQARALTYQVTGNDGIYELLTRISLNGYSTWAEDITTKATLTMTNPVLQVAMPGITPTGTSTVPVSVSLSCATTNAAVYYTLDGSVPTMSSILYATPIMITNALTLRARAFRTNWLPSEVAWMSYELPTPPAPVRSITNWPSPAPWVGIAVNPTNVASSFAVEEALPLFLMPTNISHGGVWVATNRTIRWGPFQDQVARVLNYQVAGPDGTNTLSGSISYDGRSFAIAGARLVGIMNPILPQLPPPMLTSTNGNSTPTRVTISDSVAGVALRYTLDGSLPTAASALYTTSLIFSNTTTLRARAFASGWQPSEPVAMDFLSPWPTSTVTRQIDYNAATESQEVRLVALPASGVKSYAVEEKLPAAVVPIAISHGGVWDVMNNLVRWGPFQDGAARTFTNRYAGEEGTNYLRGMASFDGLGRTVSGPDALVLNRIIKQPAATPVISPAGSTTLPVTVIMSCATSGAQIYYTTNSTVPTTNSAHYTGNITAVQNSTIRARAFALGWLPSDVASADFTATNSPTGTATRSITGNATRTPGGSITVVPTSTVRSYAVQEFLPATVVPTTISHGGIWESNTLTIRWGPFQDTTARTLTYSLLGPDGDYTISGWASFDGLSFPISGATLLQSTGAVAFVATPVISPADGTLGPVTVTITCGTSGAEIYYTTNTIVPTKSNTRYTGAFTAAQGDTVRARAFKSGMLDSDTATALFPGSGDASTVVRAISGTPSTLQQVQLTASPSSATRCYAVREIIPVALWPTNIANGGLWLADSHTIQWGPFQDNAARTLTYQVRGADGVYPLNGTSSFDGRTQAVTGHTNVTINFPPPTYLSVVPADRKVYLMWGQVAGAHGYNVHYWPAGEQGNVRVVNAGSPGNYFTLSGLTNNTRYYFTVAAYNSVGHESGLSVLVSTVPTVVAGSLGNVWFDQSGYFSTNQAVVTLEDPDLNTSTNSAQTVNVRVTSDSDAWGFLLALKEVGTNSSRFSSSVAGTNVGFTFGNTDDAQKRIRVTTLDQIHVAYNDLQPVAWVTNNAGFGWVLETFPVINGQPVSLTVRQGQTATFSVAAQGGGLRYQWFFEGSPLAGATNSSLVLSNVWPGISEGQYSVSVSNILGGVVSDPAALTVTGSMPYGGVRQTVPGHVKIERYDEGGEGIAYHDADVVNSCGYRAIEGVDMCFNTATQQGILGWTLAGEWLNYSIEVMESGYYTLTVSNAVQGLSGIQHIEIDGTDVTGAMTIPVSGSYTNFLPVIRQGVLLQRGPHMLRLVFDAESIGAVSGIKAELEAPSLDGFAVRTIESTRIIFEIPQALSTNFSVGGTYHYSGGVTNNVGTGPGPIIWGVNNLRPSTHYTFTFYAHNWISGANGPIITTNVTTLPVPVLKGLSVLCLGVTNMVFQVSPALTTNYSVGGYYLMGGVTNSFPGTGAGGDRWAVSGLQANTSYDFYFYSHDVLNNMNSAAVSIQARTLPGLNYMSGLLGDDGKMRLYFAGLSGSNYALDRTFNLAPANWVPLATNPPFYRGLVVFTNTPDPTTNNFWRVRLVP